MLPMHSEDLGRIPIFPGQADRVAPASTSNAWNHFDTSPSIFGSPSSDDNLEATAIAALSALASTTPAYVGTSSTCLPATTPTAAQSHLSAFDAFQTMASSSASSSGVYSTANPAGTFQPPASDAVPGYGDNSDMLAMWSTAPEGFR